MRMPRHTIAVAVLLLALAVGAGAQEKHLPPQDAPMPRRWLPVDEDGWTVVSPAADSRLIYVSSSAGDDDTAQFYAPGDREIGDDPLQPVGAVRPYKTVDAAMEQARDGMPDWVLLKRGDTWRDVGISARSGRSAEEPSVIRAWGEGDRPVFTGSRNRVTIGHPRRGGRHVVLMDLDLYCSFLDPASPDYGVNEADEATRRMGTAYITIFGGLRDAASSNYLVENCLLRFGGISCTAGEANGMRNCVVRRCVVLDKYPPAGHTMGLWGAYASFLLEECIFDHNGWLLQRSPENKGRPGQAIPLSHNTYCTGMYSTVFRGNMFVRAASMGNKFTANQGAGSSVNLLMDDNLYVDGEIGIGIGGNAPGPLRWVNCRVINNVMLDVGLSRPTYRNLGWYLDALDWDGGRIAGNLFLHQRSEDVSNVYAIHLGSHTAKGSYKEAGVHVRNVLIEKNIAHGLRTRGSTLVLSELEKMRDVLIRENHFQMPGLETRLVSVSGEGGEGIVFAGNTYWSDAEAGEWFRVNRQPMGFTDWVQLTHEQGAKAEQVEYPDDTRNIQNYMKHLGLEPTHEAFIVEIRKQCKANWRTEFTAAVVNDWIREGFGAEKVESK